MEGAAYGGRSVGAWACGPTAALNYGGMAGRVEVRGQKPTEADGPGVVVEVRGAAEVQSFELVHVDPESEADDRDVLPPTGWLGAGDLRVGYGWQYGGVKAGGHLFQRWAGHADAVPTLNLWPTAEVWGGVLGRYYGLIGLGSPWAATLMRPGIYGGGGWGDIEGYRLEGRLGGFLMGPSAALRLDASGEIPVAGPDVRFKAGLSVGASEETPVPDLQGSVGIVLDAW